MQRLPVAKSRDNRHTNPHPGRYHTVVIGAGAGGLTVAVGLSNLGKRVALVERGAIGGDCTNVGCVPSKTLIHLVETQHQHGLSSAEILARVRAKRDHLRDEESEQVHGIDGVDVLRGTGRLLGANRVEVTLNGGGTQTLNTKNVVLAVGARPRCIDIPGLPDDRTLTNESLFEQAEAPQHLAIIGGGVMSAEMAVAFRKLGSRVSVVHRSERLLNGLEPPVSEVLAASFRAHNIAFYTSATAERYDPGTSTLYVQQRGEEKALHGVDRVLLAIGRVPNTERLGLEPLGIRTTPAGIPTDSAGRTNIRTIYAIGDANPSAHFTHAANAQGRRAVLKLAAPWLPLLGGVPDYPGAIFSDPEIASVGPPLSDLQRRYHPDLIRTLHVELSELDRGYTEGLEHGFVRLHVMRLTGRLLSATIVAPKASEMLPLLNFLVDKRMSLYRLYNVVFAYPTHSEAIKKATDQFVFTALPALPHELLTYLRYRWRRPPSRS
ncbi:MAG: NAD(P)/FAD-dependent oxidoreductase [Trueperaceae bacterium]|nr:NAD(P)/FAD-dependent oxidoreductase [Trueperaceae bacterium]